MRKFTYQTTNLDGSRLMPSTRKGRAKVSGAPFAEYHDREFLDDSRVVGIPIASDRKTEKEAIEKFIATQGVNRLPPGVSQGALTPEIKQAVDGVVELDGVRRDARASVSLGGIRNLRMAPHTAPLSARQGVRCACCFAYWPDKRTSPTYCPDCGQRLSSVRVDPERRTAWFNHKLLGGD